MQHDFIPRLECWRFRLLWLRDCGQNKALQVAPVVDGVSDDQSITAMSKKNKLAARREAHERLLERERQQKAKKEAKRLKFQARAPKKRSIPKGLVRGSSRNPEQYEEARRIVKLRKKAARTAPKKMDLEKSGTEKRRAAATEGRKSARQKIIDKRRSMECE